MSYRRAIRILVASWVVTLCMATTASAQQSPPQSTVPAQQPPAPSVAPLIPVYPDSSAGLEKLMKDMLKLEKRGDTASLTPYLQSLVLPDSDAWFKSTFGKKWGAKLNQDYDVQRLNLSKMMRSRLDLFAKESNSAPNVVSFDGSCGSQATQQEFPLLLLHRKKFPLYSVRYPQSANLSSLSMFVFVGGGFRYIGNLPGQMNQPARAGAPQQRVILKGKMGTDGVLRDLARLSGPCWLEDLAVDATQRWHYAPTMLHGKPVEVDTTVTVIFSPGP